MEQRNIRLNELLAIIDQDYTIEGNPDSVCFNKITTLDNADEKSLIWIKNTQSDKEKIINNTPAKAVICDKTVSVAVHLLKNKCLIKVDEPKYAIISVINTFFKRPKPAGIHITAVIHSQAKIAGNVHIGANCVIGEAEIGNNVVIDGNCYIYDGSVIKDNVVIQAGAVIGSDGFGHFKNEEQKLIHFPHIGRVVIDEDVLIGSNTVIDKGVLGDTYIGKGSKINKLCVISHNVNIGQDNFITHSVCINGSVRIGNGNYIGSGSIIKNKVIIGNNCVVGIGSVVVKNVSDGEMVYGNPAQISNRLPNKPLF